MKNKILLLLLPALLLAACSRPVPVSEGVAEDAVATFNPDIAAQYGAGASGGDSVTMFLGLPLFAGWESLLHLTLRFAFNLFFCWLIVYFFYYRKSRRRDYFVTFVLFNTTMFMVICLMKNVEMSIALTLGLFAVFGMIRYRTETVPIREMTYLFVITGMAVVNGLAMAVSVAELTLANLLFVFVVFLFESVHFKGTRSTKLVLYERIDLIVPERRDELVADLEKRLGFKIDEVEIGHVDFLRDVAYIKVTYKVPGNRTTTIDQLTKAKQFVG